MDENFMFNQLSINNQCVDLNNMYTKKKKKFFHLLPYIGKIYHSPINYKIRKIVKYNDNTADNQRICNHIDI